MHQYETVLKLKEIADQIKHCGDYGQTYLNLDKREVVFVGGDADNIDIDSLAAQFGQYGYSLVITYEYAPEGNYLLISCGIEVATFYKDDDGKWVDTQEDNLPPKLFPKQLDYIETFQLTYYLQLFKND